MKKIRIILLALLYPFIMFSQGIEVVPFTGYMFGGSINYIEGELNISDGQNYGISILVPIKSKIDLELNYTGMSSDLSFKTYGSYFGYDNIKTPLQTNYFQIGVLSKLKSNEAKINPFGSISLGATWFSTPNYGDEWRFSMTLGLGVKIMFTERIGIIGRGRLMMPMQFAGVGIGIGTGGASVSTGSYITPLQGDFNVGVIIKLGKLN